ncbi:MAG: Maf family protein [Rhodospirillales bacterium]|nr:Maf family protein [Rhodospirillales bacterium]
MVLENAGVRFDWCDAGVDEDKIKRESLDDGASPEELALRLSVAKASAVKTDPEDLVIGCDQVLALGDRLFDKPADMTEAHDHLTAFSGRTHQLISAVCLKTSANVVWSHVSVADMHVRELSDEFIENYLTDEGERVLTSVGAYLLEGRGAQLFENIDGDYFTVLGLPLLPLLEELRKRGILPA